MILCLFVLTFSILNACEVNDNKDSAYLSCNSNFFFSNLKTQDKINSNFFLTCDKKYKILQFSFYSDLSYKKNSNLSLKINDLKINAIAEKEDSRYAFFKSEESLLYLLNDMKKIKNNIIYFFGIHDEGYYSIYQYNIKDFDLLLKKLYQLCNIN